MQLDLEQDCLMLLQQSKRRRPSGGLPGHDYKRRPGTLSREVNRTPWPSLLLYSVLSRPRGGKQDRSLLERKGQSYGCCADVVSGKLVEAGGVGSSSAVPLARSRRAVSWPPRPKARPKASAAPPITAVKRMFSSAGAIWSCSRAIRPAKPRIATRARVANRRGFPTRALAVAPRTIWATKPAASAPRKRISTATKTLGM